MRNSLCTGLSVLGLAFGWLGVAPARAADVEKYLPNDCFLVLSGNVQQVLDSDLMKKYALDPIKAAMKADAESEKIFKDLGLDPLKDFSRVTIAAGTTEGVEKPLVLIHGKFDVKKIEAKAAEVAKAMADKIKITKEADGTVYELAGAGAGQTMYAAALDESTIAACPTKSLLLDAQAKAGGKKKTELKNDLIPELIKNADDKASMWLVMLPAPLADKLPGGDPKAKQTLEKIDAVTGTVQLTNEVKLELNVIAKSADAAKELAATIEEGLMQAKNLLPLFLGQQEELKPVIELVGSLKSSSKDKAVTIKGGLPAESIEKAFKKG